MTKSTKLIIVVLLSVFLFVSYASADIIHLKNGRKIEGTITKETDDAFVIDIGMGEVIHKKEEVSSVEKNKNETYILPPQQKLESAKEYFDRGISLGKQGKIDEAIAEFKKAVELAPRNPKIYFNLGYAYEGKRDANKALTYYDKAIELDPKFINAYHNRAIAYWYLKKYDKSWEDVHKVTALGGYVDNGFLGDLKRDSGRDR
jgi:tetratricopeptide (TPR) repeat protein